MVDDQQRVQATDGVYIPTQRQRHRDTFHRQVIKIRASTATTGLGHITQRESANELSFQRVTVTEAVRLLDRAPCKHCALDPAPTWLVKRASFSGYY